ncbi:Fe(3+) ABC transporter substrate-binding protein [Pontibacter sp. JAM-7]|uniref:Fe(3+) ABC transporter substrate-binding protein n=1 Tax=Pontibacter sp. JAM-7 TaxID=3366581 RepID=UPI003AF8E393
MTHRLPVKNRSVLGVLALSAFGLIFSGVVSAAEVNVYSARKEALIKPLLDRFTEETGIDVNLITGKADALLKRLEVEGDATPADLFVTVDAGRLHRAKMAAVLQPVSSEVLTQRVPQHLKDAEHYWYGLSQRARTIFYNKDKVTPADLSTYEALSDPRWKGKICMRSSSNIYNQSLVASLIDATGEQSTEQWVKGLVANFAKPPAGGDTDQLLAVAAGVCELTLANTYYFGRMLGSSDAKYQAATKKIGVFWPNQAEGQRGVHVNVSGAGLTKYARHVAEATLLMEYMVSDEAQVWYAETNNEYPVVDGVERSDVLSKLGSFRADPIALNRLGENNRAAVELMDRAGWK